MKHQPKPATRGGGGGCCQGTISTGIIPEGEIFATSRNPEACCYFLVGSGWFVYFLLGSGWFQWFPSGLLMVVVISWWAPDPPASEFTVKRLVTRRENFVTVLNGEIFPS